MRAEASSRAGHLVVVLAAERAGPARGAGARPRACCADLLRALRLFGDGRVTLGALAWARIGAGSGRPLALGGGGRPHGMLVVTAEQEDELRAFCNLVSRRAPDGNELAWALRRFELGCERDSAYEALSDHLLALRALLEPEGPPAACSPAASPRCAPRPSSALELTERTAQAIALERALIAGTAPKHAGSHGARRRCRRPPARAAARRHLRPSRPRPRRPRRRAARTGAAARRREPIRSGPQSDRARRSSPTQSSRRARAERRAASPSSESVPASRRRSGDARRGRWRPGRSLLEQVLGDRASPARSRRRPGSARDRSAPRALATARTSRSRARARRSRRGWPPRALPGARRARARAARRPPRPSARRDRRGARG